MGVVNFLGCFANNILEMIPMTHMKVNTNIQLETIGSHLMARRTLFETHGMTLVLLYIVTDTPARHTPAVNNVKYIYANKIRQVAVGP